MRSGFISVLGRPNVGKSSLVNALVGEKVTIVSPKAQTTRDRINAILTTDEYQMIFVDTPGVHRPKNKLGAYMEKCVRSAMGGTDAVLVVLDITRGASEADIEFIEKQLSGGAPVFVALNKVDLGSYEKVYPIMEKLSFLTRGDHPVREIVPVSAKRGKNIEELKKCLLSVLPEGPMYYPADELTDKSVRYMIAEIVREKALLLLGDELPHGIGVTVSGMTEAENGVSRVSIDIIAEKESHKPMIIGAGGEKLKAIGESARRDVEKLLGCKVYMELYVKVRENWRDNASVMRDVGYDPKNA